MSAVVVGCCGCVRECKCHGLDQSYQFINASGRPDVGSFRKASSGHIDDAATKKNPDTPAWRAFFALARPFFMDGATRFEAWVIGAAIVATMLLTTFAMLYHSSLHRQYMTALQAKDSDGFYAVLGKSFAFIFLMLPLHGLQQYLTMTFQLRWRVALTNSLVGKYFSDGVFYRLQLAGDVDNPDQRLCNDIQEFVQLAFSLFNTTVSQVFHVVGFIGVLYMISPRACVGVIVYAAFGTIVSALGFGPWIMHFRFLMVKQEADMRYCLIRTRDNAESIAFFRGGTTEWARFNAFFESLVQTVYKNIVLELFSVTFSNAFHSATVFVPVLLVAPAYFKGDIEFGAIAQAHMAFTTVFGGLSVLTTEITSLSDLAVRVKRLRILEEAFQKESEHAEEAHTAGCAGVTCIALQELNPEQRGPDESLMLSLQSMTLRTPARGGQSPQLLVEDLSMRMDQGMSVLIVGDSGLGKSSLLRAIGGLWSEGSGSVTRRGGTSAVFMPQKPYIFLGTLREQLLYPHLDRPEIDDWMLRQALEEVNLGYILDRHELSDSEEWTSLLSGGEQQRLNFARVLIQERLQLALIDEGTSACDPQSERRLYELLRDRVPSYVSVGHRPALRRYHTHVLQLRRRGALSGERDGSLAVCSFMTMEEYELDEGTTLANATL